MKLRTLAIISLFAFLPLSFAAAKSCALVPGNAYKASNSAAVYYILTDCTKRAFPDSVAFFSYFTSWKSVRATTAATINKIPFNKIRLMSSKVATPVVKVPVVAPVVPVKPLPSITPVAPTTPAGTVAMTVDFSAPRTTISPYIYGSNITADAKNHGATLIRFGGNRLTAYNWENNASNAGTDWNNQSDSYLGDGDTAGEAVASIVRQAEAAHAATLITVPIQGYVARDKKGDGDVSATPNYLQARFLQSLPRKNATLSLQPNTSDSAVYQDEFVHWLETTFKNNTQKIFYSLDNEPDLWSGTHPRIHPAAVTYQELLTKSVDFAGAIKDNAPQSLVFGPVSYGFNGFVNLQNASDAKSRDFLSFYLDGMKAAEATSKKRLLDVLDLHWYPEAQGGGERITSDNASVALRAARVQAPRSLWDATYKEDSWIAKDYLNGPIKLLPSVQEKIDQHYPGTKIAITEYYYGGGADISGAIAQADVLGIFGQSNVFAANLWHMGNTDDRFIYAAFDVYRNYDGKGSAFGDVALKASVNNAATASVYASTFNNQNKVVLVLINKSTTEQKSVVNLSGSDKQYTKAKTYVLTSSGSKLQSGAAVTPAADNTIGYTMPASSVSVMEVSL